MVTADTDHLCQLCVNSSSLGGCYQFQDSKPCLRFAGALGSVESDCIWSTELSDFTYQGISCSSLVSTEAWSYSFCPCHTGSFCIAKGSVFKDASEVLFWVWKNRADKNDSLFIWCFTRLRTCANVAHCPRWPGSQPKQAVAYHLQKSVWRQGGFNSLPKSLCFSFTWLREGTCL